MLSSNILQFKNIFFEIVLEYFLVPIAGGIINIVGGIIKGNPIVLKVLYKITVDDFFQELRRMKFAFRNHSRFSFIQFKVQRAIVKQLIHPIL